MEQLIETMWRFPCLWDTTCADYKDPELREAAWQQVQELTNMPSVKEVKIRWKKLRDSYRDALKRQENATSKDNATKTPWKYQNLMSFLQPHMSNRTKKPVKQESNTTNNGIGNSDASDEESNYSYKRKRLESFEETGKKEVIPIIPEVMYDDRLKAVDPMDMFFNAMCQSTKRLPYLTQLKLKRVIFNAVTEAEESFAVEQQNNYASMWENDGKSSSSKTSSKSQDDEDLDAKSNIVAQ